MKISKDDLEKSILSAKKIVKILGVVALDVDWEHLASAWAKSLVNNPELRVSILCESDNMLFSKSFTTDAEQTIDRMSFRKLQFDRNRVFELTELFKNEGITPKNFVIEIMHLQIPVNVIQIDDRIFVNLWLHKLNSRFEEITKDHVWRNLLELYLQAYFNPNLGRKYSSGLEEEILELYDHQRIPRGIYPRKSFYDTDYSQLVVWAFVFDRKGQLLIHRRSDNAKDNQLMWDKSVGGHVDYKLDLDTSRAVIREVIEELFSDEVKESKIDFNAWSVSDREMLFLGDWRPDKRKKFPFLEVKNFEREWIYFRLLDSQSVYSPRTLPQGTTRRLRVIADVYLFVTGTSITQSTIIDLKNSKFKLIKLSDLKNAMDKAIRNEEVEDFDDESTVPKFTPDLTNAMTGELRDILEEFSQYIQTYVKD